MCPCWHRSGSNLRALSGNESGICRRCQCRCCGTAIAILAGFLAQLVGWLIFASLGLITIAIDERLDYGWLNDSGLIGNVFASVTAIVGIVVIIAASLAPLVGLYFLFTRYAASR